MLSIVQDLKEVSLAPDDGCSHSTNIFSWFKEFKRENFSLEEDERRGWSRTAVTEKIVTDVRKMLEQSQANDIPPD